MVFVRSILREKSMGFFEILDHDKKDWIIFWNSFCKNEYKIMKGYCEYYSLNNELVEKKLFSLGRPFLDNLKMKNENIKSIKAKTVKTLASLQGELKLTQEDFTIYMIGALGIDDAVMFDNDYERVVILDIVSMEKNGNLDKMPEIAKKSAFEARNYLDARASKKV